MSLNSDIPIMEFKDGYSMTGKDLMILPNNRKWQWRQEACQL